MEMDMYERCHHGLMKMSCQNCNPRPLLKKKPVKPKPVKVPRIRLPRAPKIKPMGKREFKKLIKGIRTDFKSDHNHDFPGEEIPDDVWWDMADGMLYGDDGRAIRARLELDGNRFPGGPPMSKDLCKDILADLLHG